MHRNFPQDPITVTIGILALGAAIFGWLGGGLLWATILAALVSIPLLIVEWIGFLVYEHLIEPRRTTSGEGTT